MIFNRMLNKHASLNMLLKEFKGDWTSGMSRKFWKETYTRSRIKKQQSTDNAAA